MNVNMIVFSQTGNTRKVGEAMAEAFRMAGHSVQTISLKKASPTHAAQGDLLGIGAPCFSSQAPTPIKAYLATLPVLNNKPAFVFATAGGAPGRVLYDLTRLLSRKGADVLGGFLARGELYHPAPALLGRFPGRPDANDLEKARRFATAVADHVSAGRSGPVPESHPNALEPGYGFYDLVARMSPDPVVRRLMPEPRLNQDKCDECRWCLNECPMGNISMQPFPVIGRQCIRCYRCSTGCPQQAYDVDWRIGNLVVLSMYNTAFERWFGDIQAGETFQ